MPKISVKHILLSWLAGAIIGFFVFAVYGFGLSPSPGTPISEEDAREALSFAFRGELQPAHRWIDPSGSIDHTRLVRRAYVHGDLDGATPSRHSEQVLKIGWPFTMVRGFIRVAGTEIETEGAWFIADGADIDRVRFLPIQPVWPGVLLDGLLFGLLLIGMGGVIRALAVRTTT